MSTIAEDFVDFILDTPFEAIPPKVILRVQSLILDLTGASLAGVTESSSQAIIRTILSEATLPQATIFGVGRTTSMGNAALVNGTIAHALELDDDHRLGTVHAGAVVVPAALASAEVTKVDGATFLRAVTLGYEVTCRAGEAFLGKQYYQGFHPTSTCGVFGAAVAAGISLGLNRQQFVNAMGIAGTQAFGLGEWRSDGSWIKRLHPGRAAQSGILAAQLAKEGFTGPATIFEGNDGFLRAFSYNNIYDKNALLRGLGIDYTTLLTAFKPYPGCRFAHAAMDIAREFLQKDQINPQDVVKGVIRIYKTDILNYTCRPSSRVIAQFSLPYLFATALVRGTVTLDHLTENAIQDPDVLAVSDKIQVVEDDEFTARYPELYSTEIQLYFASGAPITRFCDCPSGDPKSSEYARFPQSFGDEIEAKFRNLLNKIYDKSHLDSLIQAISTLPDSKNIEQLSILLGQDINTSINGGLRCSVH